MGIRVNYTQHLSPPVQAVEKGSSASLRFDRLAPTYHKEYASARRFLARLAAETFLTSLPAIEFVQESFLRNKAQIDQLQHR